MQLYCEVPIATYPICMEYGLYLHREQPDFSEFPGLSTTSLFCIGKVPYSTNPDTNAIIGSDLLLRVGFCNGENRLRLEVATGPESLEFIHRQTLSTRSEIYQICVQISSAGDIQFAVDDHVIFDKKNAVDPILLSQGFSGLGEHYQATYFRVSNSIKSIEELILQKGLVHIGENQDIWKPFPKVGMVMAEYLGPYSFYAINQQLYYEHFSTRDSLVDRVVATLGIVAENSQEASEEAATQLGAITDRLAQLIEDGKDEPSILRFFKLNPAAAFLIEPQVAKQWREVPIQHYGTIDFVFKTVDGRYNAVEIESPLTQIFKKDHEFHQKCNHAIDQVETWLRGAARSPEALRVQLDADCDLPFFGSVVIGRGSDKDADRMRQDRWHQKSQAVGMKTWDDVIAFGKFLCDKLRNPEIQPGSWAPKR